MEELNNLDEMFKNGLQNARIEPPAGVWEGIASSAKAGAAGSSTSAFVAGKWIAAMLAVASVGAGVYYFATREKVQNENSVTQSSNNGQIKNQENPITPDPAATVAEIPKGQTKDAQQPANSIEGNNHRYDEQTGIFLPPNEPFASPTTPSDNKTQTAAEYNGKPRENSPANVAVLPCSHQLSIKAEKISNTAYAFDAINPVGPVKWIFENIDADNWGYTRTYTFPDEPGLYQVKAYAFQESGPRCRDSAKYTIKVPGIKPTLTNVFTPNGDGINDQYYVNIQKTVVFELNIYDKQKNLVFSSNSPDVKWDGNCRSNSCPEGKYQVILSYKFAGDPQPTVLREVLTLTRQMP